MNWNDIYIKKTVKAIFSTFSGNFFNSFAPIYPPIVPPIAQSNAIFQSI